MRAPRWLLVAVAVTAAAAVSASCGAPRATTTGAGGGGGEPAGPASSSSSTGTGGSGPTVCKSKYSTFPKGECDLLAQDCPLGRTCKPVTAGTDYTTKCVISNGLKTTGEPCYADGECDAKLFCAGGLLDSKCASVCCESDPNACNGGTCNFQIGFNGTNDFMTVCRYATECQLLTENACAPGLDCHVEDSTQGLATCGSGNGTDVPELGTCNFLNDCGNMQDCFTIGAGGGTCYWYCFLDDSSSAPGLGGCPAGETCRSSYAGYKIDYHIPNVGLCIPTADGGAP